MADITPVPASLAYVSGKKKEGVSGEALGQGAFAYRDTGDGNKLKLCTNADTAAKAQIDAVILTEVAAADHDVIYIEWEEGAAVNLGATLVSGTQYWLSTGGLIKDTAPATGEQVSFAGVATTTAILSKKANSGVAAP